MLIKMMCLILSLREEGEMTFGLKGREEDGVQPEECLGVRSPEENIATLC